MPTVTPKELRRLSLLKAEREGRFWRTLVEDSRLSTAGQEGQSTEREEQLRLYQIRQWGAEGGTRSFVMALRSDRRPLRIGALHRGVVRHASGQVAHYRET